MFLFLALLTRRLSKAVLERHFRLGPIFVESVDCSLGFDSWLPPSVRLERSVRLSRIAMGGPVCAAFDWKFASRGCDKA